MYETIVQRVGKINNKRGDVFTGQRECYACPSGSKILPSSKPPPKAMAGHGVIWHTFLQHIEVIVLLRLLLLLPRKVWVVETARLPYGTGVGLGLVDARGHSCSCTWRERSLGEFRWGRSWERRIFVAKKSRMLLMGSVQRVQSI